MILIRAHPPLVAMIHHAHMSRGNPCSLTGKKKEKEKMVTLDEILTKEHPENDRGTFVQMAELARTGDVINIVGVDFFTNQSGEGAWIMFRKPFEPEERFYTCTHAVNAIATLKKADCSVALANGDFIQCRVVKRSSTINRDRIVYKLV